MSKSKVSLYSGILFLVYGSFLLLGSLLIKNSGLTTLGAGFIPKLISIAIIVLSAILVIQSFFEIKLTKGQDDNLTQVDKTNKIDKTDKKTVLMTITILIIYVALIKPIGFIIMSIPYLFCQMLLLEKNKLYKNKIIIFMIIAVATPFIINFIFSKFFTLMLPQGILG